MVMRRAAASVAGAAAVLALSCVQSGEPERVEISTDSVGEADAAGVPLEFVGLGDAAVQVAVHVNGSGPHSFIVGTGATMTCVDAELADRLGLPAPVAQIGGGVAVGGRAGAIQLVSIDSVRVGRATASALTGCVLDLSEFRRMGVAVEGLLGLNFLRTFTVTLDFDAGRLILEAP